MTDRLKKMIKLEKQEKPIPNEKELIRDWLNNKVETLNRVRAIYSTSPASLNMGEINFEEGEYEVHVKTCAWLSNTKLEVHIFQGLKILADAVDAIIRTRKHGSDKSTMCCYFNYKGIEFFELYHVGEELK